MVLMGGKLIKFLALIFVGGVCFTGAVGAQTSASSVTIVFENFGQQVTLVKKGLKAQYYSVVSPNNGASTETVMLSNQLIVKTNKSVNKQMLFQFHSQVADVKPLFVGEDNYYYAVKIKDSAMLANVLSALQHKLGVELVQPDILQITNSPATTALKNKPQLTEIEKEQRKEKRLKRRKERIAHKGMIQPKHEPTISLSSYLKLLAIPSQLQKNQGKGVKIAIIDDGFNLEHPALKHLKPSFSYDLDSNRLSAAPLNQQDSHGTKVAGIIFAADLHSNMAGIAPQAELIPLRHTDTWTSKTILSFYLASLAGADIINCSWLSPRLMQPIAEVINELALTGRNGKGTVIVFSAGNQGKEISSNSTEASIDSAIVVAAYDSHFKRLSNSGFGKTVDITAYGGQVLTTFPDNKYGYFSNTSLSSAVVSGIVALMLNDQPEMSLQQVQQKLQQLLEIEVNTKEINKG